jgi:hypothetical protein
VSARTSLALDPKYRAQRLRCLAQHTLGALGAGGASDEATIIEHSVYQACAELEEVERAISRIDQTSVLLHIVEGIRHRLELALDSGDLLAALLVEAEPGSAESEVAP